MALMLSEWPVTWLLNKIHFGLPLPGRAYLYAREGAIINLINQLAEPVIKPLPEAHFYPPLQVVPKADCKRYEVLYATRGSMA